MRMRLIVRSSSWLNDTLFLLTAWKSLTGMRDQPEADRPAPDRPRHGPILPQSAVTRPRQASEPDSAAPWDSRADPSRPSVSPARHGPGDEVGAERGQDGQVQQAGGGHHRRVLALAQRRPGDEQQDDRGHRAGHPEPPEHAVPAVVDRAGQHRDHARPAAAAGRPRPARRSSSPAPARSAAAAGRPGCTRYQWPRSMASVIDPRKAAPASSRATASHGSAAGVEPAATSPTAPMTGATRSSPGGNSRGRPAAGAAGTDGAAAGDEVVTVALGERSMPVMAATRAVRRSCSARCPDTPAPRRSQRHDQRDQGRQHHAGRGRLPHRHDRRRPDRRPARRPPSRGTRPRISQP